MKFQVNNPLSIAVFIGTLGVGLAYPAGNTKCGGVLTGLFGQFRSPNFPEKYPDNLKCQWKISAPAGFYISINFTQFDIENYEDCSYDYVLVSEGNKTIGHYCGKEHKLDSNPPLKPLSLNSNEASVDFITDHSNEEVFHGFEAHYAAKDINECLKDNGGCMHFCNNYIGGYYCTCRIGYHLAENNKSCIVECKGNVMNDTKGVIQSPEYPNPYPPFSDCEWNVVVERGYSIVLEFDDFSIEEHPDYLCPYDWLRIQFGDGSFKALCGDKVPPRIVSNANWLFISFQSDEDENRKGFRIQYHLERVKCPAIKKPDHGYILGPRTFSYKDIIYFSCDPGYNLTGNRVIRCQSNGQWNGKRPFCKIKSCGKPETLYGGIVVGNQFTYGSVITYKCGSLYNLVGKNSSTCLANGTWSGPFPKCHPVCGRTKYSTGQMNNCRQRIFGGIIANQGSHPWIAGISRTNVDGIICGGSLISDEWVLTAAHCFVSGNERLKRTDLKVYLGKHFASRNGPNVQQHQVSEIITHSKFNTTTFDYDIALLRLNKRAKMTPYIRPICLATEQREKRLFRPGTNVMVSGWGVTRTTKRNSGALKELCIPIVSSNDCQANFKKYDISKRMLCAGRLQTKTGICKGDSGGPLIAYDGSTKRWLLGGISSWGDPSSCGTNYDVFTRVSKLTNWIEQHVFFDLKDPFN